jgi:hypothetical protein
MKKLLIPIGILSLLGIIFGSMHSYASTKVNNTLEETLDGVSFGSTYLIHKLEIPTRHIFHIEERVANASRSVELNRTKSGPPKETENALC